jgi:hypothetical protein
MRLKLFNEFLNENLTNFTTYPGTIPGIFEIGKKVKDISEITSENFTFWFPMNKKELYLGVVTLKIENNRTERHITGYIMDNTSDDFPREIHVLAQLTNTATYEDDNEEGGYYGISDDEYSIREMQDFIDIGMYHYVPIKPEIVEILNELGSVEIEELRKNESAKNRLFELLRIDAKAALHSEFWNMIYRAKGTKEEVVRDFLHKYRGHITGKKFGF